MSTALGYVKNKIEVKGVNFNLLEKIKSIFTLSYSSTAPDKAKLLWLIKLRWLVISFLILIAPIGYISGYLNRYNIVTYSGVISLMFCFNLFTQWVLLEKTCTVRSILISFQLMADLVVLSGLLILTGGLENPFWMLIFLNMSLGAWLLSGKQSVTFLILGHQALFLIQFLSTQSITKNNIGFLLTSHSILLIFWAISRSLGDYIYNQNIKLMKAQINIEKLDRLRAVGALSAGFSHEFASPLNTLKLRLDRELRLKKSDNLIEMQKALLSCETVLKQMNNSQLDSRDFYLQTCDLATTTESVVKAWKMENSNTNVILNFDTKDIFVKMSSINFSQALINLLDNAVQAQAHKMTKSQIHIYLLSDLNYYILSVQNSYSSFSQDVLDRFGEPFLTTKNQGTGLGLYSVQLFAQAVGGKAVVQNTKSGVEISIFFPRLNESANDFR